MFTLGLALVACGGSPRPVEQTLSTAAVTLRVAFPAETGLRPLGTPATARKAVVKVYDGERLETTLEIESFNPSRSVNLKTSTAYRFETSVQDWSGQEVAWGTRTYTVSGYGDSVDLQFRSILGDAKLTSAPLVNGTVDVGLQVFGLSLATPTPGLPGQTTSPIIPLADFEVTYKVTGGTLDSSSKLGARITPAGTEDVTVTATVSGLDRDHNMTTLERTLTFAVTRPEPSSVSGQVQNWLTDKKLVATVRSSDSSDLAAIGAVDATGALELRLPDSTLATTEQFNMALGGVTWEVAPGAAQALSVSSFSLQANDRNIGLLELGTRATHGDYAPGDRHAYRMIYVDRDVTGKGQSRFSTPVYVSGEYKQIDQVTNFDVSLKRGWNLLVREVKAIQKAEGYPYPGSPNPNPTFITEATVTALPFKLGTELPEGLNWYASFANVTDMAVEHTVSNSTPLRGNSVTHTVKITNNGPYSMSNYMGGSYIIVELPKGVSYDYNSGCSYTSDYSGVTGGKLSCYYSPPAVGQSTSTSFRTSTYETTPSTVTARLEASSYHDLDTSNDLASVTITGQAAGGSSTPRADLQAPQVTFQTVGLLEVGAAVTLRGTVYDNSKVVKVEMYEGVRLLGTATVSGTTWTYAWTPNAAGTFRLRAVAYDEAGNTEAASTSVIVK